MPCNSMGDGMIIELLLLREPGSWNSRSEEYTSISSLRDWD